MCGIVGVLNLENDRPAPRDLLQAMTDALSHRGPDDEGLDISGPIGFGHRRLSILDIGGGHQPMWHQHRGKGIVFNGEIYNYREIRSRLLKRGEVFQTNSDTEVLLRLASCQSHEWLQELNGMFAFAFWDESERCLLLARDRLGIKPLYYSIVDGRFWFASEIKALLLNPEQRREVRASAISEYLVFRRVTEPETLFEGIWALPPGHVLAIRQGARAPSVHRYWEDGAPNEEDSLAGMPVADQFHAVLDRSVQYRLISDVPVGTYNSGGIDSTLTTAATRKFATGELHTFSVGFEEASHDESKYAQIVADRIGTNHHLLIIDHHQFADAFMKTVWFNDEPLHHAHTVPLRLLSRLAKEYVTVVLTGEGADETFAGYPRYHIPILSQRYGRMPRSLSRPLQLLGRRLGMRRLSKLLELIHDPRAALMENARFVTRETLSLLGVNADSFPLREKLYERIMTLPIPYLERVLIYDRSTYMLSLLHRLDRTTMAGGVEGRVPFLDHHMVNWSKGLQARHKMVAGRENKVLLKKIVAEAYPRDMVYRRKMGFDVPISEWLRAPRGFGECLDLLNDERFYQRGYFKRNRIREIVDQHYRGHADHGDILWELINLEVWHRTFIDALGPLK
jgi:asparagine synthase (glutamine-hydrolysing)